MHLAYIDCSNLFIEAQKVSAVARGWAHSLAEVNQQGPIDFGYRLDFHRLMTLLREVEEPVSKALGPLSGKPMSWTGLSIRVRSV